MVYGAYKENAINEYQRYKEQTLKLMPEEIWSKCNEIYFYSCMYEYFMYNEDILCSTAEKLAEDKNIIGNCWKLYLKHEEFSVKTWKEIEELLQKYLEIGEKSNGSKKIYNTGICRAGKSYYRKIAVGN